MSELAFGPAGCPACPGAAPRHTSEPQDTERGQHEGAVVDPDDDVIRLGSPWGMSCGGDPEIGRSRPIGADGGLEPWPSQEYAIHDWHATWSYLHAPWRPVVRHLGVTVCGEHVGPPRTGRSAATGLLVPYAADEHRVQAR